ncbi:MAG: cytochrome-c peroxidase [Flavobacteriales bacterium]|nr:cytochrome-c peroxidase [Flavobacteriales bacterium]
MPMKKILFALVAGTTFLIYGCQDHTETHQQNKNAADFAEHMRLDGQVADKAKKIFAPLNSIAENPDNPITEEKVRLGKMLYFDKRLSKEGNISCNSCHNLATAGVDNLPTSPGDDGGFGDRNSPTVLNAAHHFLQFWDGRMKDVEEQAGGPILNPVEMAIPDKDFLVERLKNVDMYKEMFASAFPESNSPITYWNVQQAIAAFERTLITPSRFDDYLNGDSKALTLAEKEGLKTFMESGCITCHSGVGLGGHMFQKFGLYQDYWHYTGSKHIDEGRFAVTKNEADKYIFKVPSLRNITETYPYFHDGSVQDLGEAIQIMAEINANKRLSEDEVKSIQLFLGSLSGELPEGAAEAPKELATL